MKDLSVFLAFIMIIVIVLMFYSSFMVTKKNIPIFSHMYGISLWGIIPIGILAAVIWRIL